MTEILTTKERIKTYKQLLPVMKKLEEPTKNKIVKEIGNNEKYPEIFIRKLINQGILEENGAKEYHGNQYTSYTLNRDKYRETLQNSEIYQDISQIEAWERKLIARKGWRWLTKDESQ